MLNLNLNLNTCNRYANSPIRIGSDSIFQGAAPQALGRTRFVIQTMCVAAERECAFVKNI